MWGHAGASVYGFVVVVVVVAVVELGSISMFSLIVQKKKSPLRNSVDYIFRCKGTSSYSSYFVSGTFALLFTDLACFPYYFLRDARAML